MELSDFHPRANLVTRETTVVTPYCPVIDGHNHLELFFDNWVERPLSELLDAMDSVGVRGIVDLDGAWGDEYVQRHLDVFKAKAPERFAIFGGVNFDLWPEYGDRFGEYAAETVRGQVRRGAQGIKVWKNLGLHVHDQDGGLARINDARLDPLWAAAGELGVPVTMHIADPVAFFAPLDNENERYEELVRHPEWHFPSPPFPPFHQLMEDLLDVVSHHPQTTFIGAHAGCYAENLGWVAQAFERCPNFHIDISARIAELGRQPYTARRFFLQYADRILFGTDAGVRPAYFRIGYRFLETEDEYFNYSPGPFPPNGRWQIYGLALPGEVLEKVYYGNAARLIGFPRRG